MNYSEELTRAMTLIGRDPAARFVGYGLKAGKASKNLAGIDPDQIVETPTAENLMLGVAIGLSLRGLLPVVFFERMDFILNAADALVNHLDKIKRISRGQFRPKVIVRCVVGNRSRPLFTGETHTQDFTEGLREMLTSIVVVRLLFAGDIGPVYSKVLEREQGSAIVVEYKDLY